MEKRKLYWVTTDDGDEDWFVIAKHRSVAEKFFEGYEGYDPGDAMAEKIREVPDDVMDDVQVGYVQVEDLVKLGFTVLRDDNQRIVKLGNRIFSEGSLQSQIDEVADNIFESRGQGRPNKTTRSPEQ